MSYSHKRGLGGWIGSCRSASAFAALRVLRSMVFTLGQLHLKPRTELSGADAAQGDTSFLLAALRFDGLVRVPSASPAGVEDPGSPVLRLFTTPLAASLLDSKRHRCDANLYGLNAELFPRYSWR